MQREFITQWSRATIREDTACFCTSAKPACLSLSIRLHLLHLFVNPRVYTRKEISAQMVSKRCKKIRLRSTDNIVNKTRRQKKDTHTLFIFLWLDVLPFQQLTRTPHVTTKPTQTQRATQRNSAKHPQPTMHTKATTTNPDIFPNEELITRAAHKHKQSSTANQRADLY